MLGEGRLHFRPGRSPHLRREIRKRVGHFRPNTEEGRRRLVMLERLYRYYAPGGSKAPEGNAAEDFDPDKWPGAENTYWKSLLRTMPTDKLEAFYRARLGEPEY